MNEPMKASPRPARRLLDEANRRAQERADLRAALGALHSAVIDLLYEKPEAIPPTILEKLEAATGRAEAVLFATRKQ